MALDCTPPYTYRPIFVAGSTACTIPMFIETRSRLNAGGTFFRSKAEGIDKNDIQVEVTQVGQQYTLNVYVLGVFMETYGPFTQIADINDNTNCIITPFSNFRNGVNLNSVYIEMPILDEGGQPEAGTLTWTLDDQADCANPFPITNLSGGDGGPTDGTIIGSIRTGPERTLIGFTASEIVNGDNSDTGQLFNPPQGGKIKQWDGNAWIAYDPANMCTVI